MDLNGNGVVLDLARVMEHKAFKKRLTFDGFVKMCVLSGCDYTPSLPGIGLAKACKFMVQNNMSRDTSSVSTYVDTPALSVYPPFSHALLFIQPRLIF